MSFKNWANQEMQSHGSKISFKDWLSHEVKKHGNATLKEWGHDEMKSHNKRYGAEGFAVFGGRGFQIKFDNGYKISIMFGVGNYADHHRGEITMEQWDKPPLKHESRTAEVAVIKPDGDFVRIGANDDVAGWLSPSEVSKLIAATATGDETKIQNALSLDSKSAEYSNMDKKGMLHKLFREQNIPLENVEQLRNSGKRVSGNGTEDYEINLQGDVYNFSLVGTAVDEVGEGYFVLNEVEDANRKYYKGKPHIFDYSMEYEKPLKSLSKFSRLVYGNMKNAETFGAEEPINKQILSIAIDISGSTASNNVNQHYRKMAINAIMAMKPDVVYIVPYNGRFEDGGGWEDWREAIKWLENDKNLQPYNGTMPLKSVLQDLDKLQETLRRRYQHPFLPIFSTMILTDVVPLTYGFNAETFDAEGNSMHHDLAKVADEMKTRYRGNLDLSEIAAELRNGHDPYSDKKITLTHGQLIGVMCRSYKAGRADILDNFDEYREWNAETEESNFGSVGEGNNFGQMRAESNTKTVGAIAVGGAIGMALFGLITGKNLFTQAKDSLKQSAEAKKDCHSCNTNGSVRKNHTQVLSSEYSVGQINPVEVEGQNDVHGAEGITNPRHAPNVQPDPHRSKSLRMW